LYEINDNVYIIKVVSQEKKNVTANNQVTVRNQA